MADTSGKVNEHLANERTHLAFLRTSVALVTFGITINRFSLFLIQQDKLVQSSGPFQTLFGAEQAGIGIVVVAALLLVWSAIRFTQVSAQIDRGGYRPSTTMVWVVTVVILLCGGATLIWLFQR